MWDAAGISAVVGQCYMPLCMRRSDLEMTQQGVGLSRKSSRRDVLRWH